MLHGSFAGLESCRHLGGMHPINVGQSWPAWVAASVPGVPAILKTTLPLAFGPCARLSLLSLVLVKLSQQRLSTPSARLQRQEWCCSQAELASLPVSRHAQGAWPHHMACKGQQAAQGCCVVKDEVLLCTCRLCCCRNDPPLTCSLCSTLHSEVRAVVQQWGVCRQEQGVNPERNLSAVQRHDRACQSIHHLAKLF